MNRKKKQGKHDDELNFWQPASDMFSAMLLILMLVILLLGLYIVHIPEYNLKDPDAGNTYADSDNGDGKHTETPEPTAFFWFPGGGNESSHPTYPDGETPSPSPTPTVSPTPDLPGAGAAGGGGGTGGGEGAGEGPGEIPDAGLKSAVYVMLVDADTGRGIKEAGVQFELYGDNHSLLILNTYYPERISFRMFETTETGVFYLPEKLQLGLYELHELTEPEGYDASSNIEFDLNETFDWSEPLVVRVPLYPSRNIIRLKMTDEETGRPLSGAEFDVVAAENIITSDGTLRYRIGQVVSSIVCDESGIGESEEIYLGEYLIRQRIIPDYYVGQETDIEASVEKKSGTLPPQFSLTSTRTKISISLKDELYPTRGIGGAVFSVQAVGSGEPAQEYTTNSSGSILLDSLEKGTVYRITQISSEENYRIDSQTYSLTVSADGRIDGETEASIEAFNHMIRVAIGITDEFSDIQVADVNLALYDAGGTLVRTWTTTGAPLMFNNLEPGFYYIIREADTSMRFDIQVYDTTEVQYINMQTSYLLRYLIMGGVAALILIVTAVAVILIVRRRRRKRRAEE
ncbi:MAG: hypothetical protein IKH30_04660 [Clostridia bacterium]|nr:hypothetical protein [Clostridia bacterium]